MYNLGISEKEDELFFSNDKGPMNMVVSQTSDCSIEKVKVTTLDNLLNLEENVSVLKIDVESYEQVVEYKGKVNTDVYAHLIHNTAVQYNSAHIVVENASMGHHVVMKLIEMEYKNLYWTIKDLTRIHESNANQLYYDPYNVPKNAVAGFTMSMKSRPVCVARMEEDLRTHEFILHSKRTVAELETFIFHNGKPEAMDSYNDDLVMSLAIGMYVRATTLKYNSQNEDITKQLLSGLHFSSTPYEFGIYKTDDQKKEEQFSFDVCNGHREDLRWMMQ